MTIEKLKQILDKQKIVRYRDDFIKAMTEAVNAAIDECVESAEVEYDNEDILLASVNKQSITKNKIKL